MQLAARRAHAVAHSHEGSHRLTGLAVMSLFPALFWTALLAGVGAAAGYALSPLALATFAAAIAAFLAGIGHALFSRS